MRKELDKVIVEMRCRKMEGKDPQGERWKMEGGSWKMEDGIWKMEDEKQEDGR